MNKNEAVGTAYSLIKLKDLVIRVELSTLLTQYYILIHLLSIFSQSIKGVYQINLEY